jgi:site-specific DNA-methyltransferase (cytosine-N4-specific)
MYCSPAEEMLASADGEALKGKVQLVFTSPPFPLNRKKRYGNEVGDQYISWLTSYARPLTDLLTPDGSIVIEMGNAWEPGEPAMSTLTLEALLAFMKDANLRLCQQFVCHNPARLPAPAQWVNVERIRVKDAFTHVWWMAPSARPKANNRRVLVPYSRAMKKLLDTGLYNSGKRPSEYNIGDTSFLRNNGGAIPSNVLSIANTSNGGAYRAYCEKLGLKPHPARMQPALVEFFVDMLTDRGDIVFDPFAGSNTTGAVAEERGRRWVSCETSSEYVRGSRGRFEIAEDSAYDEPLWVRAEWA